VELFGFVDEQLLLDLCVKSQSSEIRAKCFAVDLIVEIGDMSFSAGGAGCDGERVVDSQVCEFYRSVVH